MARLRWVIIWVLGVLIAVIGMSLMEPTTLRWTRKTAPPRAFLFNIFKETVGARVQDSIFEMI
jgi:hypothetical protein